MNSNEEPFALRLYRSLLLAFPAEFRREYGREMVFVFQHRWAEERGVGALLLWLQVVADVFTAALREHLAQVAADSRYTARVLGSNPGFAVVAVLVLAFGISASATAFTLLNAALIRPLPYPEADRLVFIDHIPKKEARHLPFSTHEFFALKRAQTLAEVGAFQEFELTLRGDFEPQRIRATYVAGRLLPLLGVKPILGRLFTDEEDRPGAPKVILLSHALWLRRYGADPAIIGRQIRCGGESPTVIGVMPPGFLFPSESHLWVPAAVDPAREKPTTLFLNIIGRMRPGVSVAQARAEIVRVIEEFNRDPATSSLQPLANVVELRSQLTGGLRDLVFSSMGAVGLVLLIAWANIANLLLARATARRGEMALRAALGATQPRIVQQLFVESAVLAALGGCLGMLLALAVKPAIIAAIPTALPFWLNFDWDWRVLSFVASVCVLTTLLIGIIPAWRLSRMQLSASIRQGVRGGPISRTGRGLRNLLVIAEVSMAVVLLGGAGLLLRSFLRIVNVDKGFEARRVLTFTLTLPDSKVEGASGGIGTRGLAPAWQQSLAELAALPGAQSAAISSYLPFSLTKSRRMTVEGVQMLSANDTPPTNQVWVSPGFFNTLRIPLLSGRDFTWADQSPWQAMVDKTLADRYWPGQSAVGKRIRFGSPPSQTPWHTIIGVVGDVKNRSLTTDQPPTVYTPAGQMQSDFFMVALRSEMDPATLTGALRQRLAATHREALITDVRTMQRILDIVVWQPRFFTILFTAFALIALLMTTVGVYGVVAYSVTQRKHELAVRIALGASAGRVVRMVVGQAMLLTGSGVIIGIVGAAGLGKVIQNQLFEIRPMDGATWASVCALLLAAAAASSYVPAHRATSVNPIIALRQE